MDYKDPPVRSSHTLHMSAHPAGPPKVAIVIATYDRSNVLAHAIESVRRSSLTEWELLVVGDACTDDTAEVVAGFHDPRIRFVNLEHNVGEQSGPNNVGASLVRAPILAFLNHDDLFFPDHLARSLAHLEATGADLVFSAVAAAEPRSAEQLAQRNLGFTLLGVSPDGSYQPYVFAPASGWVMRRALMDELGGWRPARDCSIEPSQDFLFRAWRANKRLLALPAVTVLAVQSGKRKDSYLRRQCPEVDYFSARMKDDPGFREAVISSAAFEHARRFIVASRTLNCTPLQIASVVLYKWICRLGFHPRALIMRIRHGRGGWIRELRRIRGLDGQINRKGEQHERTS
ncbi:MAG: glycosyltransferase family 2 protein [Thiobacillus sp.]|nr:glycosyltransferase family 2 protein [Thiobacillus sp.]